MSSGPRPPSRRSAAWYGPAALPSSQFLMSRTGACALIWPCSDAGQVMGMPHSAQRPWQDPHIRFFTRASLSRLLESCGCTVIASGGYSEVGFLQGVPILRRLTRSVRPSSRSDALMRAFPTLAALRLYAVAQIG